MNNFYILNYIQLPFKNMFLYNLDNYKNIQLCIFVTQCCIVKY